MNHEVRFRSGGGFPTSLDSLVFRPVHRTRLFATGPLHNPEIAVWDHVLRLPLCHFTPTKSLGKVPCRLYSYTLQRLWEDAISVVRRLDASSFSPRQS